MSEAVQSPVVTIAGKAATVSTTDNITYTATYTLQASDSPDGSGNVPYTIALTDLAGNTANYTELTTGVNIAFNNTPTIAATGTLQALSTAPGTPSASTSFSVSGFNLTAGILVTPPSGFEVSTDNANFTGTVTIGAAGIIASTPVYVRLAAADAAGNYSGNIALTSTGASEVDAAIPTSTVAVPPTTVTSINPVSTGPTKAATLDYTVTFATALTTPPSTSDFTLTGAATGTINSITGSGTTYDVNVTNVSGNGTLELDMTSGSDASPTISNVPFTGNAYTIDNTAPTANPIAFASNDPNPAIAFPGETVTLSFTTSEQVLPPMVNIAGQSVQANTPDNIHFTASYMIGQTDLPDPNGNVPYTISLTDQLPPIQRNYGFQPMPVLQMSHFVKFRPHSAARPLHNP